MKFDFGQYNAHIQWQLREMPRDKCLVFAVRAALRVLPLLARDRSQFLFWKEEKRRSHLLAVLASMSTASYCVVSKTLAAVDDYAAKVAKDKAISYFSAYDYAYSKAYANAANAAYAAANAASVDAAVATANAASYVAISAASSAFAANSSYPNSHAAAYAAAYAVDAAYAAYAVDHPANDIIHAIRIDLTALPKLQAVELLNSPLWPNGHQNKIDETKNWLTRVRNTLIGQSETFPSEFWQLLLTQFKDDALSLNSGFEVWLDWYDDRVQGKPFDLKLLERWHNVPEEIKSQGVIAVNAYLANLVNHTAPLNRVRAIFIGYGEAGKTSLIHRLFGDSVEEGKQPQTAGIEIREWSLPDTEIKAHCWDFGGQVMAHATHQFFLRSKCLYVLVLNARNDVDGTEQAEYWLEHVKSFGHSAPVMLIGNKADAAPVLLDLAYLQNKYKNIVGFFPISCTKADEPEYAHKFNDFRQQFCAELKKVGTHQIQFTPPQFAVLQRLREYSSAKAFISHDDFNKLCSDQGIGDEGVQNRDWLLDLLDKLGMVIYFPNLPWLEEYVLNPRWLTYGVYTLIYHGKARLHESEVVNLLSSERVTDELGQVLEYPRNRCRFVMDAMREFKLCYYLLHDNNTLIIPALLPSDQPSYQYDLTDGLTFEFVFRGFLPRHVLPELIVRRHEEIENETVWQHGVLLKHRELRARALLRADYHERVLFIWVQGRDAKDYLHLLRDEVLGILARLQIDYEEMITLPLATAINLDPISPILQKLEKANYKQLLNSVASGIYTFAAEQHVYDLKKLLGLILPDTQFNQIVNVGGNMQHIQISGSTVYGSVVAAETIVDSFKELAKTKVNDEVNEILTELLNEIKALNDKVPAAQAQSIEDLSNDAKALVVESARPEPRAERYKVSLKGLKEAAQAIGDIAGPILQVVGKLSVLLGAAI